MAVQKDFFKYNPETDGNLTFNIDKALNENWDKVNEGFQEVEETAGKIKGISVNGQPQGISEDGNVDITVPEIIITDIVISADDWTLDETGGFYKAIANEAVTAKSVVKIHLNRTSLEIAGDCGLEPVTESYDGGFYIYAEEVPASAMSGTLEIIGANMISNNESAVPANALAGVDGVYLTVEEE